jgi:hypothetical protein
MSKNDGSRENKFMIEFSDLRLALNQLIDS